MTAYGNITLVSYESLEYLYSTISLVYKQQYLLFDFLVLLTFPSHKLTEITSKPKLNVFAIISIKFIKILVLGSTKITKRLELDID